MQRSAVARYATIAVVAVILGAVAFSFRWDAWSALGNVWPIVLYAVVCPLSMWLMMRFMPASPGSSTGSNDQSRSRP
ncbi:MAG: hypothetical protein M3R44_07815 [Candidatus Eremiobacteraeota bacterium]|nr:hypothetical protein [Candidatus Eremiobacteraeota bacterium]